MYFNSVQTGIFNKINIRVLIFLKYFIFWFFVGQFSRILFLIFQFDNTKSLSFVEILLTMIHGARLDLSLAGYFTIIPTLLLIISVFIYHPWVKITITTYSILMILISLFIVVLDLELYKYWNYRMDATPLLYVGKEAIGSGDLLTTVIMTFFWIILSLFVVIFYFKYVSIKSKIINNTGWKTSILLFFLMILLIIPIRGTFGVAPLNTGFVYFHDKNIYANHAAINVVYNFGYAVNKFNNLQYPDNLIDDKLSNDIFSQMITQDTLSSKLVKGDKPNILLIVLESYSFRFIEKLGGYKGVTPNINRLIKEGILFDNFYSSGDRTDIGLVSILSGYPRQPLGSIIKFPRKTQLLPYISKMLKNLGYHTSYIYGGNLDFANFRSYLVNGGFDNITSDVDFPDDLDYSKWGVHDEYVFDSMFQQINKYPKPFFKMMMTLTNHEPFDVPIETIFKGDDNISKFKNSAFYTDLCLNNFIEKAKKEDWWDNTWVIISADHGHPALDNEGLANPDRFKIPMLWLGGALLKRDTIISSFGTQTDIANTIAGQLNIQDESFTFSSNILSKNHNPFALYIFNNGYGYLSDDKFIIYENTGKKYLKTSGTKSETDSLLGISYIQKLYKDYNTR